VQGDVGKALEQDVQGEPIFDLEVFSGHAIGRRYFWICLMGDN